MPELPEVETICRQLQKSILGKTIQKVELLSGAMTSPKNAAFCARLRQKKIQNLTRCGKYLCFSLSEGTQLVVHLKMSGWFRYCARHESPEPYCRAVIFFGDHAELHFSDVRRLGRLWVGNAADDPAGVAKLGLDPFARKLTPQRLYELLQQRRLVLKVFLMNQAIIAGIGNIYASEILFESKLNPVRLSATLNKNEAVRLHKAMRSILRRAIHFCGTTFSRYQDVDGSSGDFGRFLKVYGKAGEACLRCRTNIQRIVQGGRSTFFCPRCQR